MDPAQKSYASIAKGNVRSSDKPDDRNSGGVTKTSPTSSTRQSEQVARSKSIHSFPPLRTVTHERPNYLNLDLEKLKTFMHTAEAGTGKSFTDTTLVGMEADGNFTFHKKTSDKNKEQLMRFRGGVAHCLRRRSEIEALLCGFTLGESRIPDFFSVGLIKNFIEVQMETPVVTELYTCEVNLLRYCLLGEVSDTDVLDYSKKIYSVLVSQWGIKEDNHDFFWGYIRNFFQRYTADFQGRYREQKAFHTVESTMKNVMGCAHYQRLIDLSDDTQSEAQVSVLGVETPAVRASGYESQLGAAVAGEAAITQSMAALDIQERGSQSEAGSCRSKGARPKSLGPQKMHSQTVPRVEACDAGKILTEEILNEGNALMPVLDHKRLLERIDRLRRSDNAFVCMNKNGEIRFENKLNNPRNKTESADFGRSVREYELWARAVFNFFHSQHNFYKGRFRDTHRERMQVRTCHTVLKRYENHPYISVLRTTFLLFKAVHESSQGQNEKDKSELLASAGEGVLDGKSTTESVAASPDVKKKNSINTFSGILGRMISTFTKYPGYVGEGISIPAGVNQSGPLETIASSGRVYCFFENVLKRCRRMHPEGQDQLNIVREHFNNSLRELGIEQRLS
ncbi:hypothetical protein GCM10023116_29220 [Kistimonas scapharcae]|uniref:Uncharacterized protein n=1 Tax=Kistimonas scapharcae TaxID=1036133 RepID=A0ABP8V5E2_9GAMM